MLAVMTKRNCLLSLKPLLHKGLVNVIVTIPPALFPFFFPVFIANAGIKAPRFCRQTQWSADHLSARGNLSVPGNKTQELPAIGK
jgi:hypothetical protein